ncbi:hypothetical protein [Anaerorhabdus sp.]|uniref:hypothetical protein n=1 Tax=Anaerorhabdus sp. TaxID=1872524 RepID=UPI002FCB2837
MTTEAYQKLDIIFTAINICVTTILTLVIIIQAFWINHKQKKFEIEMQSNDLKMRTYEDKRQLYHFASRMVSLATFISVCRPSDDTEEGIAVYYYDFFKANIVRYGLKLEEIMMFRDISQLVLEEEVLIAFDMLCQNMKSIEIYVQEFYADEEIRNYKEAIENVKSIIRCCEEVRRLNIVDSLRERIRVDV